MSDIKLKAASGGGSISLKGPSTSGSDDDFLDTSGNVRVSGRFLLGTTDNSGYSNRSAFFHKTSGSNFVSITSDGSNSAGLVFGDGVAQNSNNYETYMAHNNSNNIFSIFTNQGNKQFNFKTDGELELQHGNLKIGNAGSGIDFSATADGTTMSSELFDDYEEGTFTAVLGGSTNHSTYNVSSTNAHYTKVGRVVHVHMNFHNQNLDDSAAGYVKITGLPFSDIGSSGHWSSNFSSHNVGFDTDRNQVFYVSGSAIYGLQCRNGASWIDWDVGHFNPGTMYLRLDMTYTTT